MNGMYKVKGVVELFPQDGGWHYVRVPKKISEPLMITADRGLVAITAQVGTTKWDTSLLPYGDGTQFIALPKKVRAAEKIELDDTVEVTFTLRVR